MSKKIAYVALATLVIAVIFVWQYSEDLHQTTSSVDPALMPIKQALLNLEHEKGFQQLNKEEKLAKANALLEQLPPEYKNLKRQYQIAMSSLPDIEFHGRVIDQYNAPVANAQVYYTGTSVFLATGGGGGRVVTDQDGYFEVDTEGAELEITGITHQAIMSRNLTLFKSEDDGHDQTKNYSKHTDKKNAYVFHVWKLSGYSGAVKGYINGFYDRSGDVYTLNLAEKDYKKSVTKGEKSGHLRISCTRQYMTSNRDYGDWSARITPIDGGIQETDDLYTNLAPEVGYQSSLSIDMKKGDADYTPYIGNKRYYFTADNGQIYGSLSVRFAPYGKYEDDNACIIKIGYKINSTGSRNLELKGDRSSQPQLPSQQKLASR